jgi:Zn-finger nucleic acid-binding protein
MKCPACSVELKMADRQGVEIDYCPECRGVWLDRGELDKIIERAAAVSVPRSEERSSERRPPYDRDHDEDEYYKRKKRRGFLGDLFDFD